MTNAIEDYVKEVNDYQKLIKKIINNTGITNTQRELSQIIANSGITNTQRELSQIIANSGITNIQRQLSQIIANLGISNIQKQLSQSMLKLAFDYKKEIYSEINDSLDNMLENLSNVQAKLNETLIESNTINPDQFKVDPISQYPNEKTLNNFEELFTQEILKMNVEAKDINNLNIVSLNETIKAKFKKSHIYIKFFSCAI